MDKRTPTRQRTCHNKMFTPPAMGDLRPVAADIVAPDKMAAPEEAVAAPEEAVAADAEAVEEAVAVAAADEAMTATNEVAAADEAV